MAKGQQRPGKQTKKAKTIEKKPEGPKYLRGDTGLQSGGLGEHKGKKGSGK